ncbi:MAG: hypothetical protein NVS9B1_16850 [Candidatus Dormibacteraceae bacterium]
MTQAELRGRWETAGGRRQAASALAALLSGRAPSEMGFGRFEGRVDLRGLVIPAPELLRQWAAMGAGVGLERVGTSISLAAIKLAQLDLSDGFLPHLRFDTAVISDCRFDGAALPDWKAKNATFVRCSFVEADLRDAALGAGTRYSACDFSRTKLGGAHADTTAFDGCEFAGAEISRNEFNCTIFERCHFAGVIEDTRFRAESWHLDPPATRPRPPNHDAVRDCDFTAAELRWVSFDQLNLRGVRLPEGDGQLLLPDIRWVAAHLHRELDGEVRPAARLLLDQVDNIVRRIPGSRQFAPLNLADLRQGCQRADADYKVAAMLSAVEAYAGRRKGFFARLHR